MGWTEKSEEELLTFATASAGHRRLHGSEDDKLTVFHWYVVVIDHSMSSAWPQGSSTGEREGQKHLGGAWATLGLLRLHLVTPTAGVDLAMEPELERDGILMHREEWLLPELQVRLGHCMCH